MGPWLCSHGNIYDLRLAVGQLELQWGRGCVATEMRRPLQENRKNFGFNGAVAV